MNNKKNIRCLQLGLEQLSAYKEGVIELSCLISNLECILHQLDGMEESWILSFKKEWGALESIYSVAVVREESLSEDKYQGLIDSSIMRLFDLVESQLNVLSN